MINFYRNLVLGILVSISGLLAQTGNNNTTNLKPGKESYMTDYIYWKKMNTSDTVCFKFISKTLSYFPELKECKLIIKKCRIATTLNIRPTIFSVLFKSKTKRIYVMRINKTFKDSVIRLEDIPENALPGLFGHEFCHIIDYQVKSRLQIFELALKYRNLEYRERYEKYIDSLTVSRGLGKSLYFWSKYVLEQSKSSRKYKRYKQNIYLEPEEIKKYAISIKLWTN